MIVRAITKIIEAFYQAFAYLYLKAYREPEHSPSQYGGQNPVTIHLQQEVKGLSTICIPG